MEARARRDWATADSLKAEIEAAGWRVTDRGNRTSVSRSAPPSVEIDGQVRYGSAAAVPSRLGEPPDAAWTVVVVASEAPQRVSRLLTGLRKYAAPGTHVLVVVNDPSEGQEAALAAGAPDRAPIAGREPELLRTGTRLGYAAALNIALRRAAGEFTLLADGSAWPTGEALAPLAAALGDPDVAVAGAFGLASGEPGRIRPAALELAESPAVAALLGGWLAFRRSDYIALGPLDEHFVTPAWLDVWWTLRLRAGADPDWSETEALEPEFAVRAEGAVEPESATGSESSVGAEGSAEAESSPSAGTNAVPQTDVSAAAEDEAAQVASDEAVPFAVPPPRQAARVELPLGHDEMAWPPDRSRLNRRNMYRVLDRWGWRDDLL
jgi:hypothetical protein